MLRLDGSYATKVGLLGTARSLQSDLNQIAETADTSTPEGLNYVLTESMLALLRHPDYCISAYSYVFNTPRERPLTKEVIHEVRDK
ncbi:uncharacterized protein [Spinacia oleracea]|uniref:Uncharacterized protein isoform X2 n=1 Tax=Spinacia oleracea TaxID=3562 RepID=A0ABM3QG58_SPIOL|nr:uncharacterized protein LOC110777650 isoform X2 [Spinacia oleracea]